MLKRVWEAHACEPFHPSARTGVSAPLGQGRQRALLGAERALCGPAHTALHLLWTAAGPGLDANMHT